MSIMPNFGFRRANTFDPFDPFKEFHFKAPLGHGHGQVPVHGHGHGHPQQVTHGANETFINVKIDWKETSEAHILRADLPGVKKDEIRIQVEEDRVLKISGERHLEKDDREERESSKYHCVERSGGKFCRVFRLPENARVDHVKASMHDGVLTVVVPKEELRKPKTVHII